MRSDTLAAERLIVQLTQRNPGLRVATATVTRAERNARVFDVAGRPDFTVALESGIRFGGREPLTTALVGISVPLWSGRKQAPAARAAHYDAAAAQQEYDDLLARLTGELQDRLAKLVALQARTGQIADEIIPLAGAASTSALQRYQVGAVEFTTVLDTQDDIFDAQLRLARLIAEYGAARAYLAALVGEEWYR
jgi:outer membrane protein TolC